MMFAPGMFKAKGASDSYADVGMESLDQENTQPRKVRSNFIESFLWQDFSTG